MKWSDIHSEGVLAARYRGRDLGARALLRHAVADMPLDDGRIKRARGEAFCDRRLTDSLAGDYEPADTVTCERCQKIVARVVD